MRRIMSVVLLAALLTILVPSLASATFIYGWQIPDGITFTLVIFPGTLTFVFHNVDINGDYLVQTVNLAGNPVNVPLLFNYPAAVFWLKRIGDGVFDVYADQGSGLYFIGQYVL